MARAKQFQLDKESDQCCKLVVDRNRKALVSVSFEQCHLNNASRKSFREIFESAGSHMAEEVISSDNENNDEWEDMEEANFAIDNAFKFPKVECKGLPPKINSALTASFKQNTTETTLKPNIHGCYASEVWRPMVNFQAESKEDLYRLLWNERLIKESIEREKQIDNFARYRAQHIDGIVSGAVEYIGDSTAVW